MIHELDLLLVLGSVHQNRTYVARALIELYTKHAPTKPVAFFAFARKDDGLILLNRSLHWVADLEPNAAQAAARALAFYIDSKERVEGTDAQIIDDALIRASDTSRIIFACADRADCPVEEPALTLTAS